MRRLFDAVQINVEDRNNRPVYPKGPEQLVLKTGMCSCYGKLDERRYWGDDPETGEPIIPPHACPWYASAITAHTRRELMKAALLAPECVIGFATDAIYSEVLLDLPRLKAEADIKAGKEDKLLGDWCWSKVPAAVFIQSRLAFYLDDKCKVIEVKCRGLPVKNLEKAQAFLDDVLEAWKELYNPESVCDLKPKKKRPIARHALALRAFMPLASAFVSPDKFNKLFCKWGDVTKTIWLDDAGRKRDINEEDLDLLLNEAVQTRPKENPDPAKLSALRFPDWVENKIREEKRQEAAIQQYFNIEEDEIRNWGKATDEDEIFGYFADDEDEIADYMNATSDEEEVQAYTRELNQLLEMNVDIEV